MLKHAFLLSKLNESDWEDIEKIILKITTNKTEKNQITNFTDDIPDTAEEFEKMYPPIEIDTNKKKILADGTVRILKEYTHRYAYYKFFI